MDNRDGQIYEQLRDANGKLVDSAKLARLLKRDPRAREFLRPMELTPTERQLSRRPPRVGRNEPCPCGSGRKFKKCCLGKPVGEGTDAAEAT